LQWIGIFQQAVSLVALRFLFLLDLMFLLDFII